MTGQTRRNVIITLLMIAPIFVISGELFWQYALIDLFGMREIDWCVDRVIEREFNPKVVERLHEVWGDRKQLALAQDLPQSITYHQAEIRKDIHQEFFVPKIIDELALQTTITTSCKNYELSHWQVRVSIEDAIEVASWQAINQILDETLAGP